MEINGRRIQLVERFMNVVMTALKDDVEYTVEIKERKKKRTLDANSYYWVLLGKYADWGKVSKVQLHNEMLAEYGQLLTVDGAIYSVWAADNDNWKKQQTVHMKPTSSIQFLEDGGYMRQYLVLRGSHEYDSKEMATLIDGLINEIKGSGAPIETMTPQELATLKGYLKP